MKTLRLIAFVAIVAGVGSMAFFAKDQAPTGIRMAEAANALLDTLSADQKSKATFAFDDKERTNWIFVPMQDKERKPTRKGLRLEEMTEKQKSAALDLLRSGLSESGYKQAITIISLETILNELEKNGAMVRNPGWYFVSIFGKPGGTGKWGWRIEGHHMSLNFTISDGEVQSATPALFGANPAEIKTGNRKGDKVLAAVDDLARELYRSLDDDQKKAATRTKHFDEPTQHVPAEKVGKPEGLPAAQMTAAQKGTLERLLKAYTDRMPESVAKAQWKKVSDGGFDAIHFAYVGGVKDGEPHSYRVQGPNFIVQFLNVQADAQKNVANHIHSAWRELPSDFGL